MRNPNLVLKTLFAEPAKPISRETYLVDETPRSFDLGLWERVRVCGFGLPVWGLRFRVGLNLNAETLNCPNRVLAREMNEGYRSPV